MEVVDDLVIPNQTFAESCQSAWPQYKEAMEEIAKTPEPDYAWYCCVLWDPNILKELDEHLKWNSKRCSTILVAEMLFKSVIDIDENAGMTWQEPPMLLQLFGNSYRRDDDDYIIRVAEFSTADNSYIPESDRMYDLVLPPNLDSACIAKEITRLPKLLNVIMVWNYMVDVFEVPLRTSESAQKIKGLIYLREPTTKGIPSILIFHGEPKMTRDRVVKIQCLFDDSELEHFNKPGITRLTRRKMLSKEDDRLAVHFLRSYRKTPYDGSLVPQISFEDSDIDRKTEPDVEDVNLNLAAASAAVSSVTPGDVFMSCVFDEDMNQSPPPINDEGTTDCSTNVKENNRTGLERPLKADQVGGQPESENSPVDVTGQQEEAERYASGSVEGTDFEGSQLKLLLTQDLGLNNDRNKDPDPKIQVEAKSGDGSEGYNFTQLIKEL